MEDCQDLFFKILYRNWEITEFISHKGTYIPSSFRKLYIFTQLKEIVWKKTDKNANMKLPLPRAAYCPDL